MLIELVSDKEPQVESAVVVSTDNSDQHEITVQAVDHRNLQQIIESTPWMKQLAEENAALPNQYRFLSHHTLAGIFAGGTAAAASFLYISGGQTKGIMWVIGGATVNLTQSLLYGVDTYFFIKDSLLNFKKSWGRLSTASLIGSLATAPVTISEYKLSKGDVMKTSFTAAGNLPPCIYGIDDAVRRPVNAYKNNPNVRKFLLDKLQEELVDQDFSFEPKRQALTTVLGTTAGLLLGLEMAAAQTGYMCASTEFGADFLPHDVEAGIGISANVPAVAIGLLICGVDLGNELMCKLADLVQFALGKHKISLSTREQAYLAGSMLLIGASSYWAYYSSATSESLFETCPSFGATADSILSFSVAEFTKAFNGVMSAKALYAAMNYAKIAYSTGHDREKYQVSAFEKAIQTGPIEKIEAIAEQHFASDKPTWKKSPSCFTRLRSRFWSNQENYQALPGNDETVEKQSRCAIM